MEWCSHVLQFCQVPCIHLRPVPSAVSPSPPPVPAMLCHPAPPLREFPRRCQTPPLPYDQKHLSFLDLTPHPLPWIRSSFRVFQMFDSDSDCRITHKELCDSLGNLRIGISDADLVAMIEPIDTNGDGCVDIEEFGELYQAIMDEEEDMHEAFKVFDQNVDNFITVDELRSVLSSLGLKQGRTSEDCQQMIQKVDDNGFSKLV